MVLNGPNNDHFPSDEETVHLINAAQAGDSQAWDQLDRRFRVILAFLMRGRVPPAARRRFDTEDVLQSVMFCAYSNIQSFEYRGQGSFQRWLTTIFVNRIRFRIRQQHAGKRDIALDRTLESYDESVRDSAKIPSASAILVEAEKTARILNALTYLADDQQRAITLYNLDGQPHRVIAGELGISETSARRLHAAALARLLRLIREPGESDES